MRNIDEEPVGSPEHLASTDAVNELVYVCTTRLG